MKHPHNASLSVSPFRDDNSSMTNLPRLVFKVYVSIVAVVRHEKIAGTVEVCVLTSGPRGTNRFPTPRSGSAVLFP